MLDTNAHICNVSTQLEDRKMLSYITIISQGYKGVSYMER